MGYEWELWVQFHPGTLKGKKCAFPFPFSFPSFSLPACWVMDLVVSHLRQYIWGQHPTGGRATRQTESGSLNLVVVLNCLCPEQFMPKLFLRKECISSLFLSPYLLEQLTLYSRSQEAMACMSNLAPRLFLLIIGTQSSPLIFVLSVAILAWCNRGHMAHKVENIC